MPLILGSQESETGNFLSARPAWSTELVLGQLGLLHIETLSQKTKLKPKTAMQKTPSPPMALMFWC